MSEDQISDIKKQKAFSVTTETTLVILVSLLVFALIVGFASQTLFRGILRTTAEKELCNICTIAAGCVDGDEFDEYMDSNGTSEASLESEHSLQRVCDIANFNCLYLIKPDFDNNKVIYSLNVKGSLKSNLDSYSVGEAVDISSDEYRKSYMKILNGESNIQYVYSSGSIFGGHVTGFVPVKNSNDEIVGIMCAEVSYTMYLKMFLLYIAFLVFVAVVILLLDGFICSRLMRARVARPIKQISDEANRFAESKTVEEDSLSKVKARGNELGQLANTLDDMEREIVNSIESIKNMTMHQERINAELDIAAKIQEAALPHEFPAFPDREEFDLYASMYPAKEVGGDFYDFFLVDDDHLALVIADVSGKGVPAALFMMVSKVMVGNNATMLNEPAKILASVNDKLAANNDALMFVTVWLGILEISTGILKCCNAGHEYPVLIKKGRAPELVHDDHGLAIGLAEDMPYSQYELQLQAGDTIVVYTDGVPEARNDAGEFYGTERIIAALSSGSDASVRDLVTSLNDDVGSFANAAEQFDDLTVLSMRYLG